MSPANVQSFLGRAGYVVAHKTDYYSPLTSVSELKSKVDRWSRPSALKGVEYDLEQMKHGIVRPIVALLGEFMTFPPYEQLQHGRFRPGLHGGRRADALHDDPAPEAEPIPGGGFGSVDVLLQPGGCQNAAKATRRHHVHRAVSYEKLYTIPGIEIIAKPVQDVDVSLFQQLRSGDVLFIDSSHILKIDGDVPLLYLEVLPTLCAGVVIHIHDVPFPYNVPYPPQLWVFGQEWPMLWNEAMIVQAFLSMNRDFRITMSTPLLRYFDEDFLKRSIPFYQSIEQNPNTFSSLWLQRAS